MNRFAAVVALVLVSGHALAQSYPSRPIRILVPFVAGGSSDMIARAIATKLSDGLPGANAIVENRPGANGSIAGEITAKAPADGYTMLVGSIGVFAINPALYARLPYDPLRDFDLVTLAVTTPNILIATPKFPAVTVAELIAHAKNNPGKVSFVSSGTGSSDHLSAELFWQRTGTTGIHVPYKGGSAAMTDLIGGAADVSFQNLGAASGHIKGGRLKAIAVTSAKRVPQFPDVPTMIEAGLPGFEVYSWQAVVSPKGVPAQIAAKLHAAVTGALKHPDNRPRLEAQGFDVVAGSSGEFERFLKTELARWKSVVETAGVKAE
jgi:tripartite-type tricarboxylate transporter receptor subunit TctC